MQAKHLAEFYEYCKGLDLAKSFQFPTLRQVFFSSLRKYNSLDGNKWFLMKLVSAINSHLHLFLRQWRSTSKKHHRQALFTRGW